MKTIKFSHNYPKLHGQTEAELLAVRPITIDRDNPPLRLLEYDTIYIENDVVGVFPLPPGDYVQLIFLGNFRIPFCTIRPKQGRYGNKQEYYEKLIGETFKIEVG